MVIIPSKNFEKSYKRLVKGQTQLKKQVIKTLSFLRQDPNYPSLRLHKLSGTGYYSISVNMSIRIIIFIEDENCFLLDIGTHEEVY